MSHLSRAVLAASMLVGIASAQAGETGNRQDLNGWRLNGLGQGLQTNGTQLNRLALNGTGAVLPQRLDGIALHRVSVR
jgi:hypothetical protein